MWDNFVSKMNRLSENMTCILLSLMVLLVFLQIASRVFLSLSFSWTEEAARYLMIWVTFLGASVAFHYGAHISIEYFVTKIKPFYTKWLQFFALIICIVFFLLLFVKGIEIIGDAMKQKSASLRIPLGYVYSIIPISAILMLINVINAMNKLFKNPPTEIDKLERGET